MAKALFVISAVYIGVIGLALLVVPAKFGVGAVPDDPSSELLALLRLLGGPLLGIAVMNWMSRTADPATIRSTVILGNLVAFTVIALNDVVGVISGSARDVAAVFMVIHLAFAVAFAVVWAQARPSAD